MGKAKIILGLALILAMLQVSGFNIVNRLDNGLTGNTTISENTIMQYTPDKTGQIYNISFDIANTISSLQAVLYTTSSMASNALSNPDQVSNNNWGDGAQSTAGGSWIKLNYSTPSDITYANVTFKVTDNSILFYCVNASNSNIQFAYQDYTADTVVTKQLPSTCIKPNISLWIYGATGTFIREVQIGYEEPVFALAAYYNTTEVWNSSKNTMYDVNKINITGNTSYMRNCQNNTIPCNITFKSGSWNPNTIIENFTVSYKMLNESYLELRANNKNSLPIMTAKFTILGVDYVNLDPTKLLLSDFVNNIFDSVPVNISVSDTNNLYNTNASNFSINATSTLFNITLLSNNLYLNFSQSINGTIYAGYNSIYNFTNKSITLQRDMFENQIVSVQFNPKLLNNTWYYTQYYEFPNDYPYDITQSMNITAYNSLIDDIEYLNIKVMSYGDELIANATLQSYCTYKYTYISGISNMQMTNQRIVTSASGITSMYFNSNHICILRAYATGYEPKQALIDPYYEIYDHTNSYANPYVFILSKSKSGYDRGLYVTMPSEYTNDTVIFPIRAFAPDYTNIKISSSYLMANGFTPRAMTYDSDSGVWTYTANDKTINSYMYPSIFDNTLDSNTIYFYEEDTLLRNITIYKRTVNNIDIGEVPTTVTGQDYFALILFIGLIILAAAIGSLSATHDLGFHSFEIGIYVLCLVKPWTFIPIAFILLARFPLSKLRDMFLGD